jgi:hypothetical protein
VTGKEYLHCMSRHGQGRRKGKGTHSTNCTNINALAGTASLADHLNSVMGWSEVQSYCHTRPANCFV